MDIRRVVLFSLLALVGFSLWTNWQQDYPNTVHTNEQRQVLRVPSDSEQTTLLPDVAEQPESKPLVSSSTQDVIHVKTDVLDLSIDLKQGDIIQTELLAYPESVSEKNKPFKLLKDNQQERYVANSGLYVVNNEVVQPVSIHFNSAQKHYQMHPNQDKLIVSLHGTTENGLAVVKTFVFYKDKYLIDVQYDIKNDGINSWKGYMGTQLLRSSPQEDKSSMFHVGSYTGASYSKPGVTKYKKVSFSDMTKSNLELESEGGWIAMQQHYFLTAWIPEENSKHKFYTRSLDDTYTIGTISQPIRLNPSQQQNISAKLYLGPEITSNLKDISPGLDLTVDYGWLWFISALLFSLMKFIYSFVGNWGWSIILVTVLIKLAFYRLSATSYKSMAGMRKLQPKLLALRERYGDDKAKMSQATMELYRQEKVNPLGGCLPIIIQIPVFIALYWVLLESVELRQAPFMLWISDLSAADPYHVLPIIMGATMLIQQKLNPTPPDPMQAKVMMFLPVLFTGLFWSFPAGLVLYWIVNNTLSILQQWYITRKYGDHQPVKSKKNTAKLSAVK